MYQGKDDKTTSRGVSNNFSEENNMVDLNEMPFLPSVSIRAMDVDYIKKQPVFEKE